MVDAWSKATDRVSDEMMAEISTAPQNVDGREAEINSVWMMANSGARGSQAQMKQLGGMRGLMAKPSGEIIETPIISNFKEGLTVQEYFNSTHGARKGLADTALKTANSGYLTRRLVDVAQDCIITEEDCGTTRGITLRAVAEAGEVQVSLGTRVLGRFSAEAIKKPGTDEVMIPADTYLTEDQVDVIDKTEVQSIKVRSVLTCESKVGVCGACYGRDLARGTPVNIGEAVGVIAAQSIGEPGTQLTMRTFHIGGAVQVAEQSFFEAANDGVLKLSAGNTVVAADGDVVVMSRNLAITIEVEGVVRESYKPPYGARLKVKDGAAIKRGTRFAEWDPYTTPIITEVPGRVRFEDLVEGISVREEADEATGISNRVVIDWRASARGNDLRPGVAVLDENGAYIVVSPTAGRRVTCFPSARSSRRATATKPSPARCSPACPPKAPRAATSPVVCRGWPSCSKPVVRRIARSSRRWTAGSSSGRTTRTSAASRSPPRTVARRSSS